MDISTLPLGPYGANCSIIADGAGAAFVVDPGAEADAVAEALRRRQLRLSGIFLTHGHFDHISGVDGLLAEWPAPVFLHAGDVPLAFSHFNTSQPGYPGMTRTPLLDTTLGDGDSVPGLSGARILHLPGHSPGSCALHFPDEGILVAGDVLFAGSIGRTDLPGGSWELMARSLARVRTLPPETRVICGHGGETTIADELEGNPWLARP